MISVQNGSIVSVSFATEDQAKSFLHHMVNPTRDIGSICWSGDLCQEKDNWKVTLSYEGITGNGRTGSSN